MQCAGCGHTITDIRSIRRGFGERCWKKHLAELPEHERNLVEMRGYSTPHQRKDGRFVVVNPEGQAYTVDAAKQTCTCPAGQFRRTCSHVRYVLRYIGECVEETKPRRRSNEEIEAEIASLFD